MRREFLADLNVLAESLQTNGNAGIGTGGALARLIRAVETFGFHLATLDLRQNADVHARVVAELLATAGVSLDYQALDEAARVALLRRELASERLLASPYSSYSEETLSELAIMHAAAEAHALYGPECITKYIVSKCESVSDLLEVYILLKEAGLYRVRGTPRAAIMAVPLFETIGDLKQSPQVMAAWLALPEVAAVASSHGFQEVMVGYSDSNKDGGYLDLGLEPASGHLIARRRLRSIGHRDAGIPWPRRRRGPWRRILVRCDSCPAFGHGERSHSHH